MASHFPNSHRSGRLGDKHLIRNMDNKAYYERNSDHEDTDEQESDTGLPMWKSVAVAVVVIACFASIYPKIFHPILMYAMGHRDETNKVASEALVHPSMRHGGGHPVYPGFRGAHSTSDRFSSPGTNGRVPGMQVPAHFASQESSNHGGGTWHWLLPLYTIGIVIFLLYTLSKILWRRPHLNVRHKYDMRYNPTKDRFEASYPGMESDEDEETDKEESTEAFYDEDMDSYEHVEHDSREIDNNQFRNLQERLKETESAMHHILSQLENLSSASDASQMERVKKSATTTLKNLTKVTRRDKKSSRNPLEKMVIKAQKKVQAEEQSRANADWNPYMDEGDGFHMNDLEKALTDFKRISDNYVQEHSRKDGKSKMQINAGNATVDNEKDATIGFDVMENDTLTIQPGEGEIIAIKENAILEEIPNQEVVIQDVSDKCKNGNKNRVRQRKRHKNM